MAIGSWLPFPQLVIRPQVQSPLLRHPLEQRLAPLCRDRVGQAQATSLWAERRLGPTNFSYASLELMQAY